MAIYKNNEKITNNTTKISKGMKLKGEYDNKVYEYTIAINGDANGDGDINIRDILALNKHRLNKANLENEYLLAGDVNKDNKVDIRDIMQINK